MKNWAIAAPLARRCGGRGGRGTAAGAMARRRHQGTARTLAPGFTLQAVHHHAVTRLRARHHQRTPRLAGPVCTGWTLSWSSLPTTSADRPPRAACHGLVGQPDAARHLGLRHAHPHIEARQQLALCRVHLGAQRDLARPWVPLEVENSSLPRAVGRLPLSSSTCTAAASLPPARCSGPGPGPRAGASLRPQVA